MEALKLKTFDILTEKITVSEFENWLYNSEEFMNQINSNSFFFDIISINYKDEKWKKQLNHLIKNKYDEDFIIVYKIETSCTGIIKSTKPEETYKILSELLVKYDYDTEYNILREFYFIYEYFDSFYGSMFDKFKLLEEAKFYAKQVIQLTEYCTNFEETKLMLTKDLIIYNNVKIKKKITLKEKIFAFFKKI